MLAYVFTHRPDAGVSVTDYEDALRRFHAALAAARPRGFVTSATFRVGDHYGDWYLLESSAALDALNAAAVGAASKPSHDAVAAVATDGVGKLYILRHGEAHFGPGVETHFSKPRGMGYPELDRLLAPFTDQPEANLWRRMMVLGPPPEFCLVTAGEAELPRELEPQSSRREPL